MRKNPNCPRGDGSSGRGGSGRRSLSLRACATGIAIAVLVVGCAVSPDPLAPSEMAELAIQDRTAMFGDMAALPGPLTLEEAIRRTLRHNLERRSRMMEEALALGQLDLDRFEFLPKLTTNAGYSGRSKENASISTDIATRQPSDSAPTYSQDRDRHTFDLTMTWNVLDFGVTWFTAHQNADRALIATERRRKAVANLVQDVRFAYWRAAAAQVLKGQVGETIVLAEQALADARRVEEEQLRNPLDSLRFQKSLLENLRQLESLDSELTAARAELAALINVPPGTVVELAVPGEDEMVVPGWPLAPEEMEELAFINNPDLREQAYQARVAVDETRKSLLKLLPGVSFNVSRQYDSNSFTVYNRWEEYGAKLTWNLLNIASGYSQIQQALTAEEVGDARRLALRMAVLAQVHVGLHQFHSAARQFERADQLWKVEGRLSQATEKRQEGEAQSVMERIGNQTAAVAAQLRRYQTYAQLQQAFAKLEGTIGKDPEPGLTPAGGEAVRVTVELPAPSAEGETAAEGKTVVEEEPPAGGEGRPEWLNDLWGWAKRSLGNLDQAPSPLDEGITPPG